MKDVLKNIGSKTPITKQKTTESLDSLILMLRMRSLQNSLAKARLSSWSGPISASIVLRFLFPRFLLQTLSRATRHWWIPDAAICLRAWPTCFFCRSAIVIDTSRSSIMKYSSSFLIRLGYLMFNIHLSCRLWKASVLYSKVLIVAQVGLL